MNTPHTPPPHSDAEEPRPEDGDASNAHTPGPDAGPGGPGPGPGSGPGSAASVLPPFTPGRLQRELATDLACRFGLLALVLFVVLIASVGWAGQGAGVLATGAVVGGWVWLSILNARAAGAARGLFAVIEQQPDAAEHAVAQLLAKRGLVSWVRMMIYHAWAALRHRQGRYTESAALCQGVLSRKLGPGEGARTNLLLMLAEASLETDNPARAYPALLALYAMPVELSEALQRLGLQTRYELMIGAEASAFDRLPQKVAMAELMPAAQAGVTHAMLAVAAERLGQRAAQRWLMRRVELLCSPEQLEQLQSQGLAPAVSSAP